MKYIITALYTLLFCGCMGYQLGDTAPAGIKTVNVAAIINKTTEPAIEIKVSEAIRQRIQFDGRVEIENLKLADGIIQLTLTDYTTSALSYDKNKQTRAREYRATIRATATLKNRETGEIISEITTYGETTFPFDSNLTAAKRSALPRAAADLAKFTLDGLLEDW